MTNWLCSHGHKILKVEDSEKNPKFKVFLFEDTPALHNTMIQFRKEVQLYWQTADNMKILKLIYRTMILMKSSLHFLKILLIQSLKTEKPPDNKKLTNAQKIITWCDSQQKDKVFKLSELLNGTGLSNDSFKETRKSNQTIKLLFTQMQTDKKGYYKIS